MKLTKENVCVFIEDEAQLEQARELLVKYNEPIAEDGTFSLISSFTANQCYLQLFCDYEWCLLSINGTLITLTELEKILSDGKEDHNETFKG